MKKSSLLLILIFIFLAGCSEEVTKELLIGGQWVGTAGFVDGEKSGEPYCYPFHEGIEFKDEDTFYVNAAERDFEYKFRENDNGTIINFYDGDSGLYIYYIEMVGEDGIGLMGKDDLRADQTCYLERE